MLPTMDCESLESALSAVFVLRNWPLAVREVLIDAALSRDNQETIDALIDAGLSPVACGVRIGDRKTRFAA